MGKKIFVSYKFADNSVACLPDKPQATVRDYVDQLENYVDRSGHIYKGESNNEDLSFLSEDEIWERLKDRIADSSITIVMISPCMKEQNKTDKNQWIPWEIAYSLRETTRNDRTSHSNAILAVVLPDRNNNYEYYIRENYCRDCSASAYSKNDFRSWFRVRYKMRTSAFVKCYSFSTQKLHQILKNNMFNRKEQKPVDCFLNPEAVLHPTRQFTILRILLALLRFRLTIPSITHNYPSYIYSVKWDDFIQCPNEYINIAVEFQRNVDDFDICKIV